VDRKKTVQPQTGKREGPTLRGPEEHPTFARSVCALPAVSAAQIEAEEPDQLKFSAVETLQNPADGRSGSADGVPEFATEQLGGREQDAVSFGLRGLCDLRGRIDTGLMGQSDKGSQQRTAKDNASPGTAEEIDELLNALVLSQFSLKCWEPEL